MWYNRCVFAHAAADWVKGERFRVDAALRVSTPRFSCVEESLRKSKKNIAAVIHAGVR